MMDFPSSGCNEVAIQCVRDLYESKENSDVTLVCDDTEVRAHRFVLSLHSPVLKTVLESRDIQSSISLPGMTARDLYKLLAVMYFRDDPGQDDVDKTFLELLQRLSVQHTLVETTGVKQELFDTEASEPLTVEAHEKPDGENEGEELLVSDPEASQFIEVYDSFVMVKFSDNMEIESEKYEDEKKIENEKDGDKIDIPELENDEDVDMNRENGAESPENEDHSRDDIGSVHACDKCEKIFSTAKDLIKHNKEHQESNSKCAVCRKTFKNSLMMKIHLEEHQEELRTDKKGRVICNKCERSFRNIYVLRAHKVIHYQGMFSCEKCDSKFENYHSLKFHVKRHDKYEECDICHLKYRSKFHLREHFMAVHQGLRLKCSYCERGFTGSSNLAKHIKKDHMGIRFPCDQCDYVAKKKFYLKNHTEASHPTAESVLLQCVYCSYQTFGKYNFKHHVYGCKKAKAARGKHGIQTKK